MRQPFAFNELTGTVYYVEYIAADDCLVITEEADVTQLLEWNKRLYNEASSRFGNDFASVARVHPVMEAHLAQQGITPQDEKAWARWLNDPDNRGWRIKPGRV